MPLSIQASEGVVLFLGTTVIVCETANAIAVRSRRRTGLHVGTTIFADIGELPLSIQASEGVVLDL